MFEKYWRRQKNNGLFNLGKRPILFIDEIHRFSKSQQDSLLHAVEKGIVTLVGATTENPSFEVISALLSRSQVYVLESLTKDELINLVNYAITTDNELNKKQLNIVEYEALLKFSGGDARKLLNIVELVANGIEPKGTITNSLVEEVVQTKFVRYE